MTGLQNIFNLLNLSFSEGNDTDTPYSVSTIYMYANQPNWTCYMYVCMCVGTPYLLAFIMQHAMAL